MVCIANYEIESDVSVVSDDTVLRIDHPMKEFQSRIKNIARKDYSEPFRLSLQIYFESPTLRDAIALAAERLTECLDVLVLVTAAGIRRPRLKHIADGTPKEGLQDCFACPDSSGHDDPQSFLDQSFRVPMEELLKVNPTPAVRRAMRWYRIGVAEHIPDDQFQYFWFALEILAEHLKAPEKVADKCSQCHSALYCEKCKTHPTHKPYAKQAIRNLIQMVDQMCTEDIIDGLEQARHALMHGKTLAEAGPSLPQTDEHPVDILGRIVRQTLLHESCKSIIGEKIKLGFSDTYLHWRSRNYVHIQTVLPKGENGEIDFYGWTGFKVSETREDPPQSGVNTVVEITPLQYQRLESLAFTQGDHQMLCKRVYKRVKKHKERMATLILSTDMSRIRAAIKIGEKGLWQDLFAEIMSQHANV